MGRVTIKTVAAAVGVSPSTVSNAYNRPGQLSTELRATILAKAAELGYAGPDAAGRALRSGRAGCIGVLLTERLSYAFSDPYAVGFLTGLSEVVERNGTSILLLPTGSGEEPDVTALRQAAMDGLTTLCVPESHPAAVLAKARGIQLVATDPSADPQADWVAIDDEAAGAEVGSHLHQLGHRRIAVLVDSNRPAGSRARLMGVSDVTCTDCSARLRGLRRSLPDAELTIVSGGHNALASGAGSAGLVLDAQNRPTAIVGLSDVLALGAMDAIRTRDLAPGKDISVCGFDDIGAAAPAGLTTLRQPIVDKGRRVGELLLDPDLTQRQVLLPIELVVRSSTGPAPRG